MRRILGRFERIPVSKPFCQCLFRTVQKRNEIDIVSNRQSCQRDDIRECEFALCLVLHDCQEKIGYHSHPYLDFNGINVVAKEVYMRKILLQFLEEALNSPDLSPFMTLKCFFACPSILFADLVPAIRRNVYICL